MRKFVKSTLLLSLTAVLCLSCLFGCATTSAPDESATPVAVSPEPEAPEAAEPYTYADTIEWDGQYDVVVIGFGGAGAISASIAADNGAKVLLVEKAPEGDEGGNTRFCGQLFAYGHEDEEATLAYWKALNGTHEVPEEMLKVYTKGIAHMYDIAADLFELDKNDFFDYPSDATFVGPMSPEYPEFPGSDKISLNTLHEGRGDGYLWQQMRKRVTDRPDNIDVWFESPAMHLIQDPISKTIIGVQVEREGELVDIRGLNGVVLACGGFENNPEMIETYLGMTCTAPFGTVYNTGDGIRMATEVGADLWHMDTYESAGAYGTASFMVEDGERAAKMGSAYESGSVIFVGQDGSRQLREDAPIRHGHIYRNGVWMNPVVSERNFVVYDQAQADALAAANAIPERFLPQVIKADTLEELAGLTGMDPQILADTVATYNSFAANGVDMQFGRAAETMIALSGDGPYYAYEIRNIIFNTQGGPRKNENAEVLNGFGEPIPHLYVAGELGGICSLQYQGGGNIAETIIFGKIAGENAAAPKDALPVYDASAKESNLRFVPGAVTDIVAAAGVDVELGENEYLGSSANGMGGELTVKVTVVDGTIKAVEVVSHKETDGIGTMAIETLPAQIVEKNSTEVDTVSGATITSNAIIEAVNDALSKVN